MSQYFQNIAQTILTLFGGLKVTWQHFVDARNSRTPIGVEDKDYFGQKDGIVTLQYPFQEFPVPDNGRYKLHNEIDDCIVCDKCAKVCPVNCIDIEPVRAVEEIGKTSDGTSKRIHAAVFDIDMSKCCFCGLCTTVCPTECLTMTKDYDFSVFDLAKHNFEFSEMTDSEVAEKKADLEKHLAEKEAAKAKPVAGAAKPKPSFKPKVKSADVDGEGESKPSKPAFKPKVKPKIEDAGDDTAPKKPVFKPKVKPKMGSTETTGDESKTKAKPVFRPKIKPKATAKSTGEETPESKSEESSETKKKAVFRPKIKPKVKPQTETPSGENEEPKAEAKKKPVFRPKIKPKKKD